VCRAGAAACLSCEVLPTRVPGRRTASSGPLSLASHDLRAILERGLHAHGFARAVCEACGDERLLPFSCLDADAPLTSGTIARAAGARRLWS
jgi:hypothetical protein